MIDFLCDLWQSVRQRKDLRLGLITLLGATLMSLLAADGFRRGARSVDRAVALPRVAVFGDSFTFGLGVEDDATFVSVLGDSLRKEPGHRWA